MRPRVDDAAMVRVRHPLCAARRCQLLCRLLRVWHLLFRVCWGDYIVLSDDVSTAAGPASPPARQLLTPHEASTLRLVLVGPDVLRDAEAIQACLVGVLHDAFLLQEASEQQITDLHAQLDESAERADALQRLVYDAEAVAAHLRRRTQYLESVVEDRRVLADSLAEDNRVLRLQCAGAERLSAPTPIQCTALSSPARLPTVSLRGPSHPTAAGYVTARHSGQFAPVGPLLVS